MRHGLRKKTVDRLDLFFKHDLTERVIIAIVAAASFVAVFSLISDEPLLNILNLVFSGIFAVELSLRFVTYKRNDASRGKKAYFKEWSIDWIATIPWDILLAALFVGGGASVARLLRLPRIIRILRFRHVGRSRLFRTLKYRMKRLIEGSLFRQLAVIVLISVVVIAGFTLLFNALHTDFGHGDNLWFSVITMFSSDSLFEVGEQAAENKALILLLSFVGIVVFNGIIIAIIINRLLEHLEDMKKGRGDVYEKGHVILLGRSEYIPHVLDEIDIHCRIERKTMKAVVMREHEEIDDDKRLKSRPRVEVISRLGGAWNSDALERISFTRAAGVMIFGGIPESEEQQRFNDSLVTKTFVSISTLIRKAAAKMNNMPNIVLNYMNPSQINYARGFLRRDMQKHALSVYGSCNPVFFDPGYYAAKMLSCLCANPYANAIYNELLTAEGSEFHSISNTFPEGTLFGDILLRFPNAIPVGFVAAGEDAKCRLVPDDNEPLPCGGKIIMLAPNSYEARNYVKKPITRIHDQKSVSQPFSPQPVEGGVAIIGVNDKLPRIVEDLARQGKARIYVVDNQSDSEFSKWYEERLKSFGIDPDAVPELDFIECHFINEQEVSEAIPCTEISTALILADGLLLNNRTDDQIDADTFSRVLMVQHILEKQTCGDNVHLIVEVLTKDTESVIRQFERCSHVVGPLFIARLLTTFMLYPYLEKVFSRLIAAGEADLLCRSLQDVQSVTPELATGKPIVFADLLALRPPMCIPLGWVSGHDATQYSHGYLQSSEQHAAVTLNPGKDVPVPENAAIIYMMYREQN